MQAYKAVEWVLREHPETRNSDKELILEVWDLMGFSLSYQQKLKFRELPSTETIRRVRQRIQAEGKYPAIEQIRQERQLKSLVIQQNEPSASPKRLSNLIQERFF